MTEEEFLELAPALRFAFTFFTPREKHELVDILFGEGRTRAGERFVSADVARRAASLDSRIRVVIRDFGLRGVAAGPDETPEPIPDDDSANTGDAEARDAEAGDAEAGDAEAGDAEAGDAEAGDVENGMTDQGGATDDTDCVAAEPGQTGDAHPQGFEQASDDPSEPRSGGAQSTAQTDRAARWRLVLGLGVEDRFPDLPQEWEQRDVMLGYLYDREYGEGRNVRGSAGGDTERRGGLGESNLTVPDWINGIHELFPRRTIERLERDALDRYMLEEVVTRPEVLSRATPNPTLLKAVLRTKHLMDENVLSIARRMVQQVIDELFEKLAREIENPFLGALDRRRRSYRRIAKNFDAPETIRRNLKHWDATGQQIVIHEPIFNSRVRNHADKWRVITVVDQSGSMLDSVIHAAITASVFHGLRAIESRLVAFDTNVVDLSHDAGDPVETLMKVQLGGGTDIANALEYVESLVSQPRKTIVILITDFFEGAAPAHLMAVTKRLCESGVKLLGLAALDSDANPAYDRQIASEMVQLGAEVGAMTPGELANWVAEKVGV
jgi:Mg-chelatase subunit ChlD